MGFVSSLHIRWLHVGPLLCVLCRLMTSKVIYQLWPFPWAVVWTVYITGYLTTLLLLGCLMDAWVNMFIGSFLLNLFSLVLPISVKGTTILLAISGPKSRNCYGSISFIFHRHHLIVTALFPSYQAVIIYLQFYLQYSLWIENLPLL